MLMKKTLPFSMTMIPSIHQNCLQNGLKTMISMSCHSQHSLQTLIPLNISGNYSKDYLLPIKILQRGYLNNGIEL
jgi:hypothetical protein